MSEKEPDLKMVPPSVPEGRASTKPKRRRNPYALQLECRVEQVLSKPDAEVFRLDQGMRHLAADNDWVYPGMAGTVLVLAEVLDSPLTKFHRDPAVWKRLEGIFQHLLEVGANGRWWSERPLSGDDNINRFTLLPLCEAYLKIQSRLDENVRHHALQVIDRATAYQVETYQGKKARTAGEYPNMDAYFMVLIELAARILDRADYHRLALEFLTFMETCLLPDGGFIYYKGTNESEIYHRINVMMLVRLWELTHSARVLDLLRKTLPYYPNVAEPSGVVDNYTDPLWKHTWAGLTPVVLDTIATLFPTEPLAARHRWLANLVHEAAGEQESPDIWSIWALKYWRDEPGLPLPDRVVRYDGSIRGPRGRFGDFSWAATTGDCLDTFVGAMVSRSPKDYTALQAAGVEVMQSDPITPGDLHHERHAKCAYASGRDYFRSVIVTEHCAALAINSRIYPGLIPWSETMADCGWFMRQVWLFTPERLVGLISLGPDRSDTPATRATVYFRFGGTSKEVASANGLHTCRDLSLRVIQHNFAAVRVVPAYQFYLDKEPKSSEVVLSTDLSANEGNGTYNALVEIFPTEGSVPATVQPLNAGAQGFVLTEGKERKIVAFNPEAQNVPVPVSREEKINRWHAGQRIGSMQGPPNHPLPAEMAPEDFLLIE